MDPFGVRANLCGLAVASLLAFRAMKKQTLTRSGAAAGAVVGYLLIATGLRGMVLFFFYQLGTAATRYQKQQKAKLDSTVANHSVRGAYQVLAVSLLATGLSLFHAYKYGKERPIDFILYPQQSRLAAAVLAHHACSLADTWASELGMLGSSATKARPVLVTRPWKNVPPGTNGGVTVGGTLWSAAGGATIGLLTVAMDAASGIVLPAANDETISDEILLRQHIVRVIAFGAICGFLGSLIDSVLGATIQATDYDQETKQIVVLKQLQRQRVHFKNLDVRHVSGIDLLTNEQVNFLSVAITTALGGWILGPWWFPST